MDLGTGDSLVVRDSQGAEKWRYTGKGPVRSEVCPLKIAAASPPFGDAASAASRMKWPPPWCAAWQH